MEIKITVLPGDGIGPEVMAEGIKVLEAIAGKYSHKLSLDYGLIGASAIDRTGSALPEETLKMCLASKAVLLVAVGDPKYDDPAAPVHPEDGLLALRKGLGVFANLRPVVVFPALVDNTTLKPEVIRGSDILFVRELTGGLYFGKPKRRWQTKKGRKAVDSLIYSEEEIERLLRVAFELARSRRKKLTSVDKANVLLSSRLWREIAGEIASEYPDVKLEHMLVDSCALKLVQAPTYFDVIATENMFGDILTDEAAVLAGSMGMLPSASLSSVPNGSSPAFGLYEPVHGSAPAIAGQNIANPIATILTVALMLRYSFGLYREAEEIEKAIRHVLEEGYRMPDIMALGKTEVSTQEMGEFVRREVLS